MKAIVGATLIDGTGQPPLENAAVVTGASGRIEAAGPAAAVAIPPDAEVIRGDGMTLMPGLIDCHDHLTSHGYNILGRWEFGEPQSLRHIQTAAVLEKVLRSGYTTIRDAGWMDAGHKMAVEQGLTKGPRLVLATSPISPTGGLADRCSPSGHHQPRPSDPLLPLGIANGAEEVRSMVREVVRVGADVIKFATTGGAASRPGHGPKDIEFGPDEVRTLVEEANALGRRTMCHALGGPGLRMAVEAGANSIEHGCYLDDDPELLKMMADKNIFFVPTFSVYIFHGERGTPHGQERANALREHHVMSLQRALDAGVKVVAGTDAGGWGHPHNAMELECLVHAGMSPMQAIVAATGLAAECLGLENETGSVQVGKAADLLLFDGDPLRDIFLLQEEERVKLVIKEGTVYHNGLPS